MFVMSIKAKVEVLIYAADEPITLERIFSLLKDEVRRQLAERSTATKDLPEEGIATSTEEAASEEGAMENHEEQIAGAPVPASDAEVKSTIRAALEELITEYNSPDHGIEVRQVAGGYRMSTKPEQHDTVRAFAKSLKPPIRLSLPALETLAVVAYKQPITAPEIGEIRGVDTGGVLGTLLDRKLITTAGRKQVIGRPILYKTTKEFLLRFGLKDVGELPSMEEFEKLAAESLGSEETVPELPFETAQTNEVEGDSVLQGRNENDGDENKAPRTEEESQDNAVGAPVDSKIAGS